MWRKINMRGLQKHGIIDLRSICRVAVDRSEGCFVDIDFGFIATDSLLNYVADRSSNLKSLTVSTYFGMSNKGLVNAVTKLPMLEELEVSRLWSRLNLKDIGCSCPRLKTLKLNCCGYESYGTKQNVDESMPEISHLQLIGNKLTDTGLNVILDNCPHLQHLDLRKCLNVNVVGDLEKRCSERIEVLRRPYDSTDDYPFVTTFMEDYDDLGDIYGYDDFEEDYDLSGHANYWY